MCMDWLCCIAATAQVREALKIINTTSPTGNNPTSMTGDRCLICVAPLHVYLSRVNVNPTT